MSDEFATGEPRLSLLGLPAEIRNLIWEYTFPPANFPPSTHSGTAGTRRSRTVSPASSASSSSSTSSSSAVPADDTHEPPASSNSAHGTYPSLSLLLACKQVREETQLLAFARTPFRTRLCRPAALTHRLSVLSPAQIRAIRSLTFTTTTSTAQARQWEGDLRPLLFPVYVQCRKLLWEAVRLLPGVRFVDFVLGEQPGGEFGKGGPAGGRIGRGRTVGGAKFFFDTVVGVGLRERSGRGETHAWGDRWQVMPAEGEERCIWLVEEEQQCGGEQEARVIEREEAKRWVRVEIVRLPLGG